MPAPRQAVLPRALLAAAAALALLAGSAPAAHADRGLVKSAKSWRYQLQGDVSGLAASNVDVVAVDLDGARSQVARLKQKPGGGRRAVLAYLSIGEAEPWRPYWKSCCAGSSPSWLTGKTQGWARNYVVKFWEPGWKAIVAERVRQAMAAGFDGLYLDRIDTWESVSAPGGSRAAMIGLVQEVAAQARSIKGNAAILVQNGEELLTSDGYVSVIDAIAKEDLVHGINHDGRRNTGGDIGASLAFLKRAQARGKTVFVVEYLTGSTAESVAAELRRHGFVPNFAPRSLTR